MAAAFAALYLVTRAHHYSYDAFCYALDAERGPSTNLFHPNHLIFSFINRVLLRMVNAAGLHIQALVLIQLVNACVAGVAVSIFYHRVLRSRPPLIALGMTLLLATSYAFWSEVTDAGCYAWAVLATLCLFECFLRWPSTNARAAGAVQGLAVLFHQMLILAVPAFLWRFYWSRQERRWKTAAAFVAPVLVIVIAVYGAVIWKYHSGSFTDAWQWVFGPAGAGPQMTVFHHSWWSLNIRQNFLATIRSLAQAIVAPYPGVKGFVVFSAEALLLGWLAIRALARGGSIFEPGVAGGCWIWIACFCAFQFFWLPGALRFRLLWLPVLIWLATAATPEEGAPRPQSAVWCLIGLAVLCLNGPAIAERAGPSADESRARWVSQLVGPNDLFIYQGGGDDSVLNVALLYFAPGVPEQSLDGYMLTHPDADPHDLLARIWQTQAGGGRVFVEGAVAAHQNDHLLQMWFKQIRPVRRFSDVRGYGVFEVQSKSSSTPKTR